MFPLVGDSRMACFPTFVLLKLRGRWMNLQNGERQIPLLATLHPAYLLRQPAQKRLAWRDFLDLASKLDGA